MRNAVGWAVVIGVAPILIQACANGAMQSAQGVASAPGGSAPSYGIYGVDNYFKVEWQGDERRGKPVVSGYVTNQWGIVTRNVRLRVEALDSAGTVTATYIGYVNGYVTPGTRVYYEVPVPVKAPRYRVTVLSFEPVQGLG